MSIPPRQRDPSSPAEPVGADEPSPGSHPSARHVADSAVADTLIQAIRTCEPSSAYTEDRLRVAVVDYIDAARARGETHECAISAVRHMLSTLVVSPAWAGPHRSEARDIIRRFVALATARYYGQSAYRDAQPSTAFHFEVRRDGTTPVPLTKRGWDDEG